MMTKEQQLALKKNRLETLQNNPKNLKSGGVIRRLKREIRSLENK